MRPGVLILFILVCACSVKEDRTDCPCELSLVFKRKDDCCEKLHFRVEDHQKGFVVEGETVPGEPVRMLVKRSVLSVYALMTEDCVDGMDELIIPPGGMCPKVYSGKKKVDSRKERVSDTIVLNKNYAELRIILGGEDIPFRTGIYAELTSSVSGYDKEGSPVSGEFRAKRPFAESGECCFCLPRQTDASAELTVICPGGPEFVFPLGLFLSERGYDWTRDDLEDIILSLDYCASSVTVIEGLWNKVIRLDVTI